MRAREGFFWRWSGGGRFEGKRRGRSRGTEKASNREGLGVGLAFDFKEIGPAARAAPRGRAVPSPFGAKPAPQHQSSRTKKNAQLLFPKFLPNFSKRESFRSLGGFRFILMWV
jgi:hypothetical protein